MTSSVMGRFVRSSAGRQLAARLLMITWSSAERSGGRSGVLADRAVSAALRLDPVVLTARDRHFKP